MGFRNLETQDIVVISFLFMSIYAPLSSGETLWDGCNGQIGQAEASSVRFGGRRGSIWQMSETTFLGEKDRGRYISLRIRLDQSFSTARRGSKLNGAPYRELVWPRTFRPGVNPLPDSRPRGVDVGPDSLDPGSGVMVKLHVRTWHLLKLRFLKPINQRHDQLWQSKHDLGLLLLKAWSDPWVWAKIITTQISPDIPG